MAGWRLAHVIQRYYPFQGGSERYLQAISEHLSAAGAEVTVLTSDAWDLEYFWDPHRRRIEEPTARLNGVRIERIPIRHLPAAGLTHRGLRRLMAESVRLRIPGGGRFRRAASRFGPWLPGLGPGLERLGRVDLVHSANVAFESMMMACSEYARRKGIPHLVTPFVHLGEGPGSKVRRYYTMPHQLELVRSASAVLALTSIEADFLVKSGVDPRRVHVVGAGIDVGAVTGGSAARARLRHRLSGAVVLSLGAAAYDKGTIHLSEAVRRLRRRGVDVTLVVAGPTLAEYDAYLQRIDRDEREGIRCLGYVDNGARRDLLAAADVLALPSRTESFGLVFHEAWANGKPVIGARAGAIPAVVSHGDDGLLVQFGDVDGLTHSLSLLLSDPRARNEMGRRGRAKIVTERDWLDRVRGVYEQLLGGPLTVMGKLEGTRDGSLSALGG